MYLPWNDRLATSSQADGASTHIDSSHLAYASILVLAFQLLLTMPFRKVSASHLENLTLKG